MNITKQGPLKETASNQLGVTKCLLKIQRLQWDGQREGEVSNHQPSTHCYGACSECEKAFKLFNCFAASSSSLHPNNTTSETPAAPYPKCPPAQGDTLPSQGSGLITGPAPVRSSSKAEACTRSPTPPLIFNRDHPKPCKGTRRAPCPSPSNLHPCSSPSAYPVYYTSVGLWERLWLPAEEADNEPQPLHPSSTACFRLSSPHSGLPHHRAGTAADRAGVGTQLYLHLRTYSS